MTTFNYLKDENLNLIDNMLNVVFNYKKANSMGNNSTFNIIFPKL